MFRRLQTATAAALLLCAFPLFAKAENYSWIWTTDRQPFSFLLAFALGALALETLLLLTIAPGQKKTKVFGVLCLGNLVTFLLPYLLRYLAAEGYYNPIRHYVVGVLFLVILLVLEVPVEYNLLNRDGTPKRRLLAGLLVANAVSTAGIALLERLAFHGYWI